MVKHNIIQYENNASVSDALTDILQNGTRELISNAIELEMREFMSEHQGINSDGKVNIIRNGYLPERAIQTGIGPVSVWVSKVLSKNGKPITFRSTLVFHMPEKQSRLKQHCLGCTLKEYPLVRWEKH